MILNLLIHSVNRVIDLNQPGSLSKELPYEEYLKEIGVLQK